MTETTRRCALPGCAVPIQDIPGRPPRRYCTAAHRAAARQARRAAMQSGADSRLAATLPWLAEPAPVENPSAVAGPPTGPTVTAPQVPGNRASRRRAATRPRRSETPPGRRTGGLHGPVPRHRRALAVLGAAGILAGGYAVTSSGPVPSMSTEAAMSQEEWARDARVTLASVNRQLDAIAEVESEWLQLPAAQRAASPPAPVQALERRRELLESRRATLLSQLDAFEELDTARAQLAEAERGLQAMESTLAAAPPPARRSPEQATALSALDEQRDLRIRQRDSRREELAALEGGVENAAARPLPDDAAETAQIGEDVRRVIRGEDVPTPPPADPVPPRPEVVNGRDEPGGQPRQDVDTSGPPDPRGPGEGPVDVPPPDPAPTGPVDQLAQGVDGAVGAVGGVLDGGNRDRDRARSADRPADPAPSAPAADAAPAAPGPVETVVDTVEGVVDGPAPASARDDGPSDRNRGGDRDRGGDDERGGPVAQVVDTVGDVVAGPDQPADEARDRERDRGGRGAADAERSTADEAPARATGAGAVLSPVVDTVEDTVAPGRSGGPAFDDRYPDTPAEPVGAPASPVRDADGARTAEPAPAARALPAEAPVQAPDPGAVAPSAEAEMALEVVRATPAAAWAAPLVEVALAEAARQEAQQAGASAPSAAPTAEEQAVAAAALGMWGFDDESIDALNEMAAASGQEYGAPSTGTGTAPGSAYEQAVLEAYGIPAESAGPATGGTGYGYPAEEAAYVAYTDGPGYAAPGYEESPSTGDEADTVSDGASGYDDGIEYYGSTGHEPVSDEGGSDDADPDGGAAGAYGSGGGAGDAYDDGSDADPDGGGSDQGGSDQGDSGEGGSDQGDSGEGGAGGDDGTYDGGPYDGGSYDGGSGDIDEPDSGDGGSGYDLDDSVDGDSGDDGPASGDDSGDDDSGYDRDDSGDDSGDHGDDSGDGSGDDDGDDSGDDDGED